MKNLLKIISASATAVLLGSVMMVGTSVTAAGVAEAAPNKQVELRKARSENRKARRKRSKSDRRHRRGKGNIRFLKIRPGANDRLLSCAKKFGC